MTTATVDQAMEMLELRSYGAPARHMVEMLQSRGIDTVRVYHVTRPENVSRIMQVGIKTSTCYNRRSSVYFFVDENDTKYGDNITGGAFAILTIDLPIEVAAEMVDDGLYNATFDFSRSAARIEREIPAEWITK
jgi:hypothetical protein